MQLYRSLHNHTGQNANRRVFLGFQPQIRPNLQHMGYIKSGEVSATNRRPLVLP